MANEILSSLLKEYEQKRTEKEQELEKRREEIYKKIPRLAQIEEELSNSAITMAKELLKSNKTAAKEFNQNVEKLKKEKEEILKKENIDSSYLKLQYECKDCKDTGYISNKDYSSTMCHCLKQRLLNKWYNKANISNLDKENFNTFNLSVFSDKVNEKYNISPRKNIENIKDKAIEFIKEFDNPEYKNLLFTGNIGLGKTFMANCIAHELLQKGKTVLYQTSPVLLETIIDIKMSRNKTKEQSEFYKNVLECDLLIIDDLGTESLNSMLLSELFTILNTRILNLNSKVTKTIISTNLNIEEIFKNYEERIGSRIAGFYDIYHFFGEDLRMKKKSIE